MEWVPVIALIVGIVSLLTGGGIAVHVVRISRRWGQIEEKVVSMEDDTDDIEKRIRKIEAGCASHQALPSQVETKMTERVQVIRTEVDKVRTELNEVLGKLRAKLTEESEDRAKDLHKRIDQVRTDTTANTQSVSTVLRDIEGLLSEVRELVKDAASTGANMGNLERQVGKIDETVSNLRERTSTLEAKIERPRGDT